MRLGWLPRLALKNATRKPARTVLTAGMVVAGVALLIVAMSWLDGIWGELIGRSTDATGHVVVQTRAYAERAALMPLYENIAQVAPVLEAVRATPGVIAAYATIETGVAVGVGATMGDTFGLAVGGDPRWFTESADLDRHLVEGRWFASEDELVLGWTLKTSAGAKLGDDVTVVGQTQTGAVAPIRGRVVGIVRGGSAQIDRKVYLPLARAQRLTAIVGGATAVVAYGAGAMETRTLGATLRAETALAGYRVRGWDEMAPWDGMLPTMRGIRTILYFIVVSLAALGVWNTMMMSVMERTTEIGVLRAMGMSRRGAVALFVGEATTIALLGSAAGTALGVGATLWLGRTGIHIGDKVTGNFSDTVTFSQQLYPHLSPDVVVTAFALGVVIAFLGSLLPAIRAAAIQPVVAMRRV